MDPREKIKESEKGDKLLDLAEKSLWDIKVMVIPTVFGALGTISKGLVKRLEEIRGISKTTQTTILLKVLSRILRRVQDTLEDLLSLDLL